MRLNCVNILSMPRLARFGPHPLGAGLRRRFRTSATLWRKDPDELRLAWAKHDPRLRVKSRLTPTLIECLDRPVRESRIATVTLDLAAK